MRVQAGGRVLRATATDSVPLPGLKVVLHRVGRLEQGPVDFEKRYVFRTKNLRRLRVPRHAQCEFLKADGCSVHEAKPTQCRTFPYWPELVGNKKNLRSTAAWCPGIGQGELVNIRMARETAEEMRAAHPHLYR